MKRPVVFGTAVLFLLLYLGKILFPGLWETSPPDCLREREDGDGIIVSGTVKEISCYENFGKKTGVTVLKNVCLLSNHSYEGGCSKVTVRNQSIVCYLSKEEKLKIGNQVIVRGKLDYFEPPSNPGEFDSRTFYRNRGVLFALREGEILKKGRKYEKLPQYLYELRKRSEKVFDRELSKEHASVMKVLLLGEKDEMDPSLKKLYQKNGIAHILSISGLHISIICLFLMKIFSGAGLPLSVNAVLTGTALSLYGMMVGFTASTGRAVIMCSLMLLAGLLHRSYDLLTALSVAALLLLASNPLILNDCGFQLSFAAVLGIALLLPVWEKRLTGDDCFLFRLCGHRENFIRLLRSLLKAFLPSLAVTLTTAPVLITCFHEFSFLSVFLNLLVLPFLSVLLVAGMGMLFAGNLLLFIAGRAVHTGMVISAVNYFQKGTAFLISFILDFYKQLCLLFQHPGWGRRNIASPSVMKICVYYFILILVTFLVNKKRRKNHFFILYLISAFLFLPEPHEFAVWNLDVGQGDCNVIFTETGHTYLIDCGSTTKKHPGQNILVPFLKSRGCNHIDGIFITHLDKDHINGISELLLQSREENLAVDRLYFYQKEKNRGMELLSQEENLPVKQVTGIEAGAVLKDGKMEIACLYPFSWQENLSGNDASLVLRLTFGGFTGLFTGDLQEEGETVLMEQFDGKESSLLRSSWLKAGHHGSDSSSSELFLDCVDPKTVSISAGKGNPYGHPDREVLKRFSQRNMRIYRTDRDGALSITVKKGQYELVPFLPYNSPPSRVTICPVK